MLNHFIKLINHNFYNDYDNAILFESEAERDAYFNVASLFSAFTKDDKVNFDYGNYLYTRTAIKIDSTAWAVQNYNYAIVKDILNNKYYFYFIRNITYDSGGYANTNKTQAMLDLELDIMTTIYPALCEGDKIAPCLINQAHIERFTIDLSDNLHFRVNSDSELLQGTGSDSKQLIMRARMPIFMAPDKTLNSPLNDWLNDNILCWAYIYCENKPFTFRDIDDNDTHTVNLGNIRYSTVNGAYVVYCVPIYRTYVYGTTTPVNSNIFVSDSVTTHQRPITKTALQNFITDNGATIINVKFSYMPPFESKNYIDGTDYEINAQGLFFKGTSPHDLVYYDTVITTTSNFEFCNINTIDCLIKVNEQNNTTVNAYIKYPQAITDLYDEQKTKNELINGPRNIKFNPDIIKSNLSIIKLTDSTGTEYNTAPLTLIQNDIAVNFLYTEALTPDVTKGYLRFKDANNIHSSRYNFTGLIINNDCSIPYSTNILQEYLAQNKNFFIQSAFASLFAGISAGKNGISKGFLTAGENILQTAMEFDNIKGRGDHVKNATGNAIFTFLLNDSDSVEGEDAGLFIEFDQALDIELKKQDDYNALYGYPVNLLDKITNIQHNRLYYDFIQADLTHINASMPTIIFNKFKEIFNKGIRLWHVQQDYTIPDFETAYNSNNPELIIVEA